MMIRLNAVLLSILLAVLIVTFAGIGWQVWHLRPVIQSALESIAKAAATAQTTSDQEAAHFTAELREVQKVTADAHDLLLHTDLNLNGHGQHLGLLPQTTLLIVKAQPAMDNLTASLKHLDELLVSGKSTVNELQSAVNVFRQATVDLDRTITDPQIHETLQNLSHATADLDTAIQQMDAVLKSATATAEDVRLVADNMREKYLKARNLYYAIASELLSKGSEVMQFLLKK